MLIYQLIMDQENVNMNAIFAAIGWFIIFCITFVGDFFIEIVPGFYICYISLIFYRAIFNIKINRVELFSQIILTFIFLIILIFHIDNLTYYYNSIAFCILYINVFPLISYLIKKSDYTFFISYLSLVVLFIFIANFLVFVDVRAELLFGPNVLYRIFGFVFTILFISIIYSKKNKIHLFISIILFFLCMISTGSRGSLIVMIYILAIVFININYLHNKILLTLSIFALAYFGYQEYEEYTSRLLYFSLENKSISERIGYYNSFTNYYDTAHFVDFIFGSGESNNIFNFYPHNLFLESLVYHGAIILMVSILGIFVIITNCLFRVDPKNIESNIYFLFTPIAIGSMFSGSFFESYPVIAVGMYAVVKFCITHFPRVEGRSQGRSPIVR